MLYLTDDVYLRLISYNFFDYNPPLHPLDSYSYLQCQLGQIIDVNEDLLKRGFQ